MQNQIIYLREERNCKSQLINRILENGFRNDIPKVISYKNSNTLLKPKENYQFPKRFSKKHHQKCYNSYSNDDRFHALGINKDSQNGNEDIHVTESSLETKYSDNNQNEKHPTRKTTRNRQKGINSQHW